MACGVLCLVVGAVVVVVVVVVIDDDTVSYRNEIIDRLTDD